ncbi:uncharacterized protein TNIN_329291 [Trichonephila inaurata madagascariensis]|uniref:Uncharacterized protein n=1 Tax=Trichonephila inaurata madagascariensis TaxID=2747483 RepID=A0A8X7BQN4_9ARAC|nr:uncharacterized protein TNIN_329291 [Trichonephila inaurata madagascariensis]
MDTYKKSASAWAILDFETGIMMNQAPNANKSDEFLGCSQKCFFPVAGGASAISSASPVQFSETAAAARRGDGDGGHGHCLTTPFHQRGATRERHVRHQAHFRVQGGALRTEVLPANLL